MTMFWLGVLIGGVIGEFTGIVLAALCNANKRR